MNSSDDDISTAVQQISEAVTQCKFESSSAALDECILDNILDVFTSLVKSPQGVHLSHENLISIFQACYRIGHMKTERGKYCSSILTQSSLKAMKLVVQKTFSGLSGLKMSDEFEKEEELLSTPVSRLLVDDQEEDVEEEVAQTSYDNSVNDNDGSNSQKKGIKSDEDAGDMVECHEQKPYQNSENKPTEVVSLAIQCGNSFSQEDRSNRYGLPALAEILAFIISMIGSKPSKNYPDLPLAGIDLLLTCLHAAGPSLAQHALLVNLLKQDLFKALFLASDYASERCFAGICQVSVALYDLFREVMFPQIIALLELLLIPMAEGSIITSFLRRRESMEVILDFCRQPEFLLTIFINVDCRIGNDNLFKRISSLISKAAFVTDLEGNTKLHTTSMDGMRSLFEAIREQLHSDNTRPEIEKGEVKSGLDDYLDIWTPLCEGRLLQLTSNESPDLLLQLKEEKRLKLDLISVAKKFNDDQEKGMEYCQDLKLLPSPLTAETVARFLKACPGLSKSAIGEVLGERGQFYEEVRDSFCETFNFSGMRFDIALRLFMDAFRPPGEGQKIDRIVQSFGKQYHKQVPTSGLKSSDAAYVLAFSVIMLNTDLHNSQNKRKMTLEDFARINRNTNEGDPMPPELLSSIYGAISSDEFKISSECSASDLGHQTVFWTNLLDVSRKPLGKPVDTKIMMADLYCLRKEMFKDCWGPSLGAISNILNVSTNPRTVKNAVETLKVVAELSYKFKIDGVIDQILESLSRYTAALTSDSKPLLAYGGSIKARASVEAIFKIADMYGDSIKRGWKYIISTVMKVFLAGLLTPSIIAVDGGMFAITSNHFLTFLYRCH